MRRLVILLATLALSAGMASCTEVWHSLTIASTEGGSVNTPGEGAFDLRAGAVVDLIATPDTGYRFVNWAGDVDTIADVEAASTTIIMNGDYEIIASFGQVWELTVSSSRGGLVTNPGEGVFTYETGAVVSLVATAHSSYRFVSWTGDVDTIADANASSTTITLEGDYNITANFVAQYVLTVDSTEGGQVTAPGEGAFNYDAGTVVGLMAEPDEGYRFVNWTGSVGAVADASSASTTITLTNDFSVTANFMQSHLYIDRIGPGVWGLVVNGEGVEATVTHDGVVVDFASATRADPGSLDATFGAGGYSTYALTGDFDIRMRYELNIWPKGSGIRVGLILSVPENPDRYLNLERVGFGRSDFEWVAAREVYLIHSDHSIQGITPTDNISGTLRILREGARVSCYYSTLDAWHKIYEKNWTAEDVYVSTGTWSHDYHFGGEEVRVLLGTVEMVQPPP